MLFNIRIGGIIKYLGLTDFWNSLSKGEQDDLVRYYRGGLGADPNGSPIKGDINFSTQTPINYLSNILSWADSEKNYELADKIIERGEESVKDGQGSYVDIHFFYQHAAECYYKQRDIRDDGIKKTVSYCMRDIELYPCYSKLFIKEYGSVPRIVTFQRLAILLEKQGAYDEAIKVCRMALQYGLHDSTKGGYEARIKKLEKKLNKN